MSRLLEVRHLVADIGATRVVDDVSFHIDAGETYALLGESGCGKSMTALSLMRLLPDGGRVSAGTVALAGDSILALPEHAMRRVRGGRMAMIFQEPMLALNPVITVGDQIVEALALHRGLAGQAARTAARELLDAVGVPDAARRLDSYPFELSGGLRQRVMISMALAGEPQLLIADEPTTALDVTIQAQVLEVLRQMKTGRRMGMLLITHDLGVVAENADRVGVMYAGELIEEGTRDRFFAAPQHPYSRMLFAALPRPGDDGRLATIGGQVPKLGDAMAGCRFAPRCPHAAERCRLESPGWQTVDGQRVRCHFAGRLPPPAAAVAAPSARAGGDGGALLRVDGLKVYFPVRRGLFRRTVGEVRAVDDVSLVIPAGRTLALVGESGCGKTTVGKALLRLIEPTAGSVELAAERIDGRRLGALRRQVQMVFQDPFSSLNPRMRVADILLEGMDALDVGEAGRRREAVTRLLGQVGLPEDAGGRYPHVFSGGQRQRIAIARMMLKNAPILILDEATSALDSEIEAAIQENLATLMEGKTVVAIAHRLSTIAALDRVIVLDNGAVVEEGSHEALVARGGLYAQLWKRQSGGFLGGRLAAE